MAPLPKPDGQRIRRNTAQSSWRTLPQAVPFKRPPVLPVRQPPWLKSTREWWSVLWASPMASATPMHPRASVPRGRVVSRSQTRPTAPRAGILD